MSSQLARIIGLAVLVTVGGAAVDMVGTTDVAASTCSGAVQDEIDGLAPGTSFSLPDCIVRETLTIRQPITIRGGEIRGSDIWPEWRAEDGRWVSSRTVPPFAAHGECRAGRPTCLHPEQVFVDDQPLAQVDRDPGPGTFALDASRHVILADDPHGHVVEVTTRTRWIVPEADGIRIEGVSMRHAANDAQTGALDDAGRSMELRNLRLSDAHGAVVWLSGASELLDSDVSRGGQLGVGVGGRRVARTRIHHNNTEGFDPGWEAGGFKAVTSDVSIEDNEVDHNDGSGIWFDIRSANISITGNRVHDNTRIGIFVEISTDVRVTRNTVWRNGFDDPGWLNGSGILVHSSARVEIAHNLVAWNADGIGVESQDREDRPPDAYTAISIHDNFVAMDDGTDSQIGMGWAEDWDGPLYAPDGGNGGRDNRFWYPTSERGYDRFAWNGPMARLATFAATPAGLGSRYLPDDEARGLLLAAGVPTSSGLPDRAPGIGQELQLELVGWLLVAIVGSAAFAERLTGRSLIGPVRIAGPILVVGYAAGIVAVRSIDLVPDTAETVGFLAVVVAEVGLTIAILVKLWLDRRARPGTLILKGDP